jgi:hypothetical protein
MDFDHLLKEMDVIVSSTDINLDDCAVMYHGKLLYRNDRITLQSYMTIRQCECIAVRRRSIWYMLDKSRNKLTRCSISYPLNRYFREEDVLFNKTTKNKAVFRNGMFKIKYRSMNSLHQAMVYVAGCCKIDQFLIITKSGSRNLGELVPVLTILQ